MQVDRATPVADALQAGAEAYRLGRWEEARASFEEAQRIEDSPEAAEGIGKASWFLEDGATAIAANEHAYRLYRERENTRGAGRAATWLAWDYGAFHGDASVVNGWLQRAHRLLDDLPPCVEQGDLALREGFSALSGRGEPVEACALAERVTMIGRQTGEMSLEVCGLALHGHALLQSGRRTEGMRLLDEASAAFLGGDVLEIFWLSLIQCELVYACHAVRDYERATEWCDHLMAYCERMRIPVLLGLCRTRYADILQWNGRWSEAESQLDAARRVFAEKRPALSADALTRLGELRRRQGRLGEAAALFRQAEHHPLSILGRAMLALDQGDAITGVELAERYLRRLPKENMAERAPGLEALIHAQAQNGNLASAQAALEELSHIATALGADPLRAQQSYCAGVIAAAHGDHTAAQPLLEDAIDLYAQGGARYEAACARLALAQTLSTLGRRATAAQEAELAAASFRELGAELALSRAEAFQAALEERPNEEGSVASLAVQPLSGLTPRETEVLRLVAQGMTNAEIASRLCLSGHTVHRHVANILTKLDAPSRAAATAWAVQRGLA
ncbi:MAG TPA: LuxR C-terminal-related transcriptional regulator [Ktedonobacterales bacterium]|jgi:LuxR family transcriptional regulator, maltose regulon positive regulatory protein|nr:LuxR C-terminal-related transcriptional regulator [Ktedonobacterales bacterium]